MRLLERRVVVLVHPDEDNREMYANFLRLNGFAVLTFADGDPALRMAPIADVIITGIRLRGSIDGVQLIARIRCDERTRDTPIIVVTASAAAPYQAHAEAAGCNRFLSMPCLPEDLLHEIEGLIVAHVNRHTAEAKPPAHFDAVRVEQGRQKRSA